jgi:hypothetical protein
VEENNCLTTSGSKPYTDSPSDPSQNPQSNCCSAHYSILKGGIFFRLS